MSTASPATRDETARTNIVLRSTAPGLPGIKVTAAQIDTDCPPHLQAIGAKITKLFNDAQQQAKLLDESAVQLNNLLTQAEELCDGAGFIAFRDKFFPNLGKSRVYELLAIAKNKKSIGTTRASNRERVAKHRKNKAAAADSVTVTERAAPDTQGTPTEDKFVQAASSAREQAPRPPEGRSSGRRDEAEFGFSAVVCELIRRTHNKEAERFAKTKVPAESLSRLGDLLLKLAALKRSQPASPDVVCAANVGETPA
jgi:hypothetical protein